MSWLIKILMAHKRMRGLSETQLQELIHAANDVESLKMIKEHLESGSFRYQHLEAKAAGMIQQCIDKAKEIQWQQHSTELKKLFFDKLEDPFAWVAEKAEWLV